MIDISLYKKCRNQRWSYDFDMKTRNRVKEKGAGFSLGHEGAACFLINTANFVISSFVTDEIPRSRVMYGLSGMTEWEKKIAVTR